MATLAHRYFCVRCDRFIHSTRLADLVAQVNTHATVFHPTDFAQWAEKGIVLSSQYTYLSEILPQYLTPHGTTNRRVPAVIELTDADRKMLAAGGVKWD